MSLAETREIRLARLRQMMTEKSLDGYLVAVPENRYYISGYSPEDLSPTESSGYLLITGSRQYVFTDSRYSEDALREAKGYELIVYSQGPGQVLPDLLSTLAIRNLGLEAHYITHNLYLDLEKVMNSVRPDGRLIVVDGLIEYMRVIKDAEEVESIKESLYLTERVLRSVWEDLKPGMTEKEVAWSVERGIREGGAEAISFPPIIASGPNAALPHAVPTDRSIGEGELVIIDMGSRLRQYCSDMTRTWATGTPVPKLREIYRVVRDAQLAAQDAVRAGLESNRVDAAARDFISEAGYGDYFGHGLGHGVGLAIHEAPGLRKTNPGLLRENMIVTIEPGIYIPGLGGVRLENMVRVTATGCEVLNREGMFFDW